MSVLKKGSGTALFLFALGMSLVLVSSWTAPSYALSGSVISEPGARGVNDPSAGDPDGPNDTPPSTQGHAYTGTYANGISSTVVAPSTTQVVPANRGGLWASWTLILKLAARVTFLVR